MIQQRLLEIDDSIEERIKFFSALPYQKGKYKSRHWGHSLHSLCSYPSKIKPAIAHLLVTLFTKKRQRVLDPFSGVGTIPLECCLTGRIGIGSDINPLAYYTTHAKIAFPKKSVVNERISKLKSFISDEQMGDDSDSVDAEIREFYHPKTLTEILKAKRFFELEEFDNISSFLISCIAHILHGNRPYALSRRSHNVIPIPPKGEFVYKSLIRSLIEKSNRMYSEELPSTYVDGEAFMSSVFELPIPDDSIDAVLTSPPFLGTTEFLRQNRVRLWFCGWDYAKQNDMKEDFIENASSPNIYSKVFEELDRVLVKGGLCIFHVGVVKKRDMAMEILPFAEEKDFIKLGVVYEDTSNMESHGRTDRGSTHKHQFLFLKKQ